MIPEIKPYNHDKYTSKQSQYDVVSELPTRSMLLGPTKSRKSIVLQNLILDIYRGAFEKIYIFSPSIHIDSVWNPVKKYLEKDEDLNEVSLPMDDLEEMKMDIESNGFYEIYQIIDEKIKDNIIQNLQKLFNKKKIKLNMELTDIFDEEE